MVFSGGGWSWGGPPVRVKGEAEINEAVIARIRTMVAYEMTDEEIVAEIEETPVVSKRWVAWVAKGIRNGWI